MILDFFLSNIAYYSGLSQLLGCESASTCILATVIIAVVFVVFRGKKSSKKGSRKAEQAEKEEVTDGAQEGASERSEVEESTPTAIAREENDPCDQSEDCLNMNEVEEQLEEVLGIRLPRGGEDMGDMDADMDMPGSEIMLMGPFGGDGESELTDDEMPDMDDMMMMMGLPGMMGSDAGLPEGMMIDPMALMAQSGINEEAIKGLEQLLNPEGRNLSPEERELMDELMGRMILSAMMEAAQEEARAALEGAVELD